MTGMYFPEIPDIKFFDYMKRILFPVIMSVLMALPVKADEGMWMLPLLKQMNSSDLHRLGCRLSPEEIYSINNSSLKDAIVQFGGGCTGEIISSEGLLVTNHHCGYASIQKLSTVEHDYLTDGYWAMSRNEELPVEGLSVKFLEYMEDVTAVIEKAVQKDGIRHKGGENSESETDEAVAKATADIISKARKDFPGCVVTVEPFYNLNVWYLIVYKVYKDVRFVGAPPSSIGKFGADTDNWMWPRHTGDFSMFRVYADRNNNPAEYSPDNVPYTPKRFLKISLKGIQEGDYAMIMGYPGRTTRFQTSPELKYQLRTNDIRIEARTIRQDIMMEDMLSDPAVRIQYANKYASSSNGWKKWQGMKLAFEKLDIIERAENEERAFSQWVASGRKRSAEYGDALETIKMGVDTSIKAGIIYTAASESLNRIELAGFAGKFVSSFKRFMTEGTDTATALKRSYDLIAGLYKDYSSSTDKKISAAMIEYFRKTVPEEYYPDGLGENFGMMDIKGYTDRLFSESIFISEEKISSAVESKDTDAIMNDPAAILYNEIRKIAMSVYPEMISGEKILAEGRRRYTAGLLEWKKGEPSYPDANFTMRLTYGSVKGYSPADAISYRYYTTLDGVMEKEDPDNWEFVVPEKLKRLYNDGDFGQYAMENGKMPVAFLSNNDITGGNSGSPVLNASGELIGLAFDGNWESMSSDVMFEPELQRCINVDIRYVLFIVDKFGEAGYLLDEMEIVK